MSRRGSTDQALREAVAWEVLARQTAHEAVEAPAAWGAESLAGANAATYRRRLADDAGGCLRRARQAALRAVRLARAPDEARRATELLTRLECEAGQNPRGAAAGAPAGRSGAQRSALPARGLAPAADRFAFESAAPPPPACAVVQQPHPCGRREPMKVTDMEITGLEVQRALQEFYGSGETGHGCLQVSGVTLLGSGFETDVFAFSLAADGEDAGDAQDLVVRVYAGEGTAEKSAREFAAMGRLREAGYPVPRVLALSGDRSPLGRPFLIMERIHGVPLEWEDRRPEVQALFCRLMAQLHALNGSDILPDSPLAYARDPFAFVDGELSYLAALLSRLEMREPPSLRNALAWLGSRRSKVPCERLTVVHGDFHRNNILMRADGAPFVIDWSNVRLADYRSDLAWPRVLTRADAQPDGGESELRVYERFAGTEVRMIEYFEVAACTRLLLSRLNSLKYGAARLGMRPGAEALMRPDSDFMRYVTALLQKRTTIETSDVEDALTALHR